jgi:uncharacterized protein (TIRG00374 family)
MHWKSWLKLIGLALLIWIMSTVDWPRAFQVLSKLKPGYMAGYMGCFVAMMLLRASRLRLALSRLDHPLGFKDCYVATLEPAFFGAVTPGRLGEFSRVGYIQAHGIPPQEAIAVVTVERLIDMGLLLVFGAGGLVYIFGPTSYHFGGAVVVALGLLLFGAAIRGYGRTLPGAQKYLGWLLHWEPAAVRRHRLALAASFLVVMQRAALPVFLVGLGCILLNFVQVFLLAMAFGFQADYLMVIFAYTTATLVALLPISIGGLGTREATYITIMGRAGIIKEQALLFSLVDGFVFGVLMLFVLLLPFWILRFFSVPSLPRERKNE